jgi:nicotinate-nucleotide pyrophosphorylase (carboxylating)
MRRLDGAGQQERWASVVVPLVTRALAEDVGAGDLTSALVVPTAARARGILRAKAPGVISGLAVAREVYRQVDEGVAFEARVADGDAVAPNTPIATVAGPARAILTGERTALNFLQRLAGIATLTARFVAAVAGTGTVILDTRKTTPGLRLLEKEAVRHGGGTNHRLGLDDAIMIKDNHIAAAGGLEATLAALAAPAPDGPAVPVIVEVDGLEQVRAAAAANVDRLLLDNFTPAEVRAAVALLEDAARATGRRIGVEVSGGVTLENVASYALPGVDFISIGALTHSAPALDIALDLARAV